jgi:predicted transcriptional regulator
MKDQQREKIKVEILDAIYYKEARLLKVIVETNTGRKMAATIPFTNIYKGKKIDEEEAHRQMYILAEQFNKSAGRKIMMVVDQEKLEDD